MVRLKAYPNVQAVSTTPISIPYGAIKSRRKTPGCGLPLLYFNSLWCD